MATSDVEKLIVSLEARTKEYERALARAQNTTVTQLRRMEREAAGFAGRFDAKMSAIGANMKGFLAGATIAAVAAFGAAIKSAISDAAAIGDLADKIGMSTDELQKLSYGAVQANLSFDDLSGSLAKFSKSLGEAQNGQGELLALFQSNGFTQAQVKAMSLGQALGVVADFTRNARNEQDQMVIATTAFGKAGGEMIELLSSGSNGLRQFGKDAENAGAIIDDALIRKAQDLDDRWSALMQSMKMRTQQAVLFIADQFSKIPSSTGEFSAENVAARRQGAASRAAITSPRVIGPGSMGGPNEYAVPPYVAPTTPRVTAIPQQEEKAKAAIKSTNDTMQNRIRLIEGIEEALAADKAFSWASSYEEAYNRVDEANQRFLDHQAELHDSMQQLGEIGVNALDRIVVGGEKASDVFKDLARQLASAALQSAFLGQGPLASFGGTSAGGGLLGGIFGKLLGGGAAASIYHAGGIAGGGGMSRRVHPATFAGAERYHSGGIAGLRAGEVPAILQKGERIIPRGGNGAQAPKIIINNNAGVDVQPSRGRDGTFRFDINKAISDALASGGADGAMGARFGARPTRTRR